MYTQNNLPKADAEKYLVLIKELCPECEIEIINEDINLYQLGLVEDIHCTLQIGLSRKELENLLERINDMEVDAYSNEEMLNKPYNQLTIEEKEMRESIENSIKDYRRYQCLQVFLQECLE